jgi:DNA-binding NarL/FixJ family response regulator
MTHVTSSTTVGLVLRQPLLRDALQGLLQQEGFVVAGTADAPAEAFRLVANCRPDVLLLDCGTTRPGCLETLRELSAREPSLRILLYAGPGVIPPLPEAILAGARGILFDDAPADRLVRAIRAVARGEYWVGRDSVVDVLRHARGVRMAQRESPPGGRLTPRELQVVRGVASGESNREVAERLGLSEATVKYYVTAIYDKLGVSNRVELAALAAARGLTEEPPSGTGGPPA